MISQLLLFALIVIIEVVVCLQTGDFQSYLESNLIINSQWGLITQQTVWKMENDRMHLKLDFKTQF